MQCTYYPLPESKERTYRGWLACITVGGTGGGGGGKGMQSGEFTGAHVISGHLNVLQQLKKRLWGSCVFLVGRIAQV